MQDMQAFDRQGASSILLTTQDVQRLMKVDRSTVYRMAEDGRLPAVKVGRQWRFPSDRLHDFLSCRPGAALPEDSAGLAASLGPGALQAVSDFLGEAFGAMVVLTDIQGQPLTAPSNPCGLFSAVHRYPGAADRCVEGWQGLAAEVDLEPQWRVTPLGFLCARSLIRRGERLVGMVVAGGIAPEPWPPSPAEAAALAENLGVPSEAVQGHLSEVFQRDPRERDRILHLLPRSAAFLSRLAAEHGRLAGRLEAIAALVADPPQRSET
ncbi:MAG: helix-turn-helix domain-containing protein [Actinobacteria bacterium]|nr:helix-turn-helix domain-containing protein [Actinomycetota bacterium]